MIDYIRKLYFRLRFWAYKHFYYVENDTIAFGPNDTLDLTNDFRIGMRWGNVDPAHSWYGMTPESIEYEEDHVSLNIKPTTKTLYHKDVAYYPELSAGYLYSNDQFLYGIFEVECTLPDTDFGWPAFWLTSDISWPPEIDIFENLNHSTNDKGEKKLSNRIHWSDSKTGDHKSQGSHIYIPDYHKIKVRLEWTPDYMKFYYNGILFSYIKSHMEYFINKPMRIVVNTAVSDANYSNGILYEKFKIYNIKYKQL